MTDNCWDYRKFFEFFDTFSPDGFQGIHPANPLLTGIEHQMEKNNQLFYVADAVLLDIQYVSKHVSRMFGLDPDKIFLGYFITTTHPDDQQRHHLARTKLLDKAHELYVHKKGIQIISSTFRGRRPDGAYTNYLYQACLFYSKVPYESVFLIQVITDVSGFTSIHKGFHFYSGDDIRNFRFPDEDLLMSGSIFSETEYRIIELINEGLSSKEISEKLFRSIYTINTHRSNILHKSGKSSVVDLLRDLKGQGRL